MLEVCSDCGRKFRQYMTAEERLLQAIFGKHPLCKKCRLKDIGHKCSSCGKYCEYVTGLNEERLCSKCLSKRYG